MLTKVRIGNYKNDNGEQEYTTGCYAIINGVLCNDVTKVETSSEHGKLTSATITFTGDVGFTNEPKGETIETMTDLIQEILRVKQQYPSMSFYSFICFAASRAGHCEDDHQLLLGIQMLDKTVARADVQVSLDRSLVNS